ncbi:tRNA (adenosine(37)-N6)-threonylcarbamoyltransferase complex transferase subunit TsaD [Mariniblastus fucicola]|nr:tRNA (adenosine(37)-N6)-threonylcarbamoyltransferase complex transferase subunit TsaD [Mariniblastus fucicola]
MILLTLETTCDETAAAIVNDSLKVLSGVVASQAKLHEIYKGVVPEIAARAHVERILPVIDETLKAADLTLDDIDAIAVANTPGLSGSLLVGLTAAKALCFAKDIPLIAVNHLHAHVYACQFASETPIYPCVGLVVSGGHTHLYHYESAIESRFLGGTIDDAAGEAFDKVASMLGLPYPGGPSISKVAVDGDKDAIKFPRSFLKEDRIAFSFSGLKTAVRYAITGPGKFDLDNVSLTPERVADLAASFQQAVVDCLVAKSVQAVEQCAAKDAPRRLCVGGGVAANRVFREQLKQQCELKNIELHFAALEHCTDNAVMGAIAVERFKAGLFEDMSLDILPGLIREPKAG